MHPNAHLNRWMICLFAALTFAIAIPSPSFALNLESQFVNLQDEKEDQGQDEKKEGEQKQDEEKQDEKSKENGEADLDKALELNITAKTTRDLDRVAELCESAIKKGLDSEGEIQAKQIWVSALMEYATQLNAQIFNSSGRDRRWRIYRKDALDRLEQVTELNPENAEAHLMIARMNSLPGGDKEAAKISVDKAVELAGSDNSKLSEALFARATLAEENEAILSDLDQAIKINPENIDAIRFRGAFYLRSGQPEKAIDDFKTFLKSESENLGAYYLVVETLRSIEKYDEAIEILDKAVEVDPDNVNTYIVRAQVRLDQEKYDEATKEATKAIKLDRTNITGLLLRAQAGLATENYEDAMEDVENTLDLEPRSVTALHLRAMINASTLDYEPAIEDLKTLVKNIPENLAYQIQLASIYNANLEPELAIRLYSELLRRLDSESPARLNIYRGRADANLSLGKHKEAVADYNKAIELDPNDDHTLNNLAWVLATSPDDDVRDGKRSVELARKACDVTEWKAAHILSTLASGYAEAGDFESAKKYLSQGLEISESDEQRASMGKEMEHYEREEAFREKQDIEKEREERKKKSEGKTDDDSAKESADKDSAKKDADKKADPDKESKSDKKSKSDKESDDDKKSGDGF